LLIQQNVGGSNYSFNRSWAEFKVGFNDSRGNYWLGNDLLSRLTLINRYKLRLDLLRSRGSLSSWYYAEYSVFRVLIETYNYTMSVSGHSGNTPNYFNDHNRMVFTTYDRDNDLSSVNCARSYRGGFWYNSCGRCSLNSAGRQFLCGYKMLFSRMWLQCK